MRRPDPSKAAVCACESQPITLGKLLLPVLVVCASSGAAAADTANANDEAKEPAVLGEIVVSAQRRLENLQDVPISIQAFDAEALAKSGIHDIHDLMLHTPGVDITSAQPGNAIIVVRGLAPIGGPQTTGLYIDDIPVTGGTGGTSFSSSPEPLINDIARVEVLKGPQGTLYGDSAMGGAVKFVFNKPDATAFSGNMNLETATTDGAAGSYAGSGTLNIPLIVNKLAVRGSLSYRDDGGFVDNFDPRTQTLNAHNTNDFRSVAARIAFGYTPTDSLTITPAFLYQRGRAADRPYSSAPVAGGPNPSYLTTDYLQPYEKQTYQPETAIDQILLGTLTLENRFTDHLSLTSISGYYHRDTDEATDINGYVDGAFAGSPIDSALGATLSTNYTETYNTKISQELRLAYLNPDSRFGWTVGGFYSQDRQDSRQLVVTPGLTTDLAAQYGAGTTVQTFFHNALPTDQLFLGHTRTEPKQYAFFGELSYSVTQALKLTAGARVFRLLQSSFAANSGLFNGGVSTKALGPASFSGTNPRFVAEYEITKYNKVYASATKGFRPGKLNGNIPVSLCSGDLADLGLKSAPVGSDPDSLWNYEVGSKNELLDGRLRLNAAAYQMKWSDIQLSVFLPTCAFSFNANVGAARVRGSEVSMDAEVLPGLTIGGTGNYLDAKITDVVPNTPYRVGDELPYAPKFSYSVYLEYSQMLPGSVRGYIRGDYNRHGNAVRDASSTSTQPSYQYDPWAVANLSVGASWNDWDAQLFVHNVLNSDDPLDYANFWGQWRVANMRPRTIGINVGRHF